METELKTLRVPETTHRALKVEAATRGIALLEFTDLVLTAFLASPWAIDRHQAPVAERTKDERSGGQGRGSKGPQLLAPRAKRGLAAAGSRKVRA